jgi:ankyrin repeat protein
LVDPHQPEHAMATEEQFDELEELIAEGDYEEFVRRLEAAPSLVHKTSVLGDQLLHYACHHKQVSIAGHILGYHPDVNHRGSNGWTPLHWAVEQGDANSALIVSMLLARGANPRIRGDDDRLPIDLAKVEMTIGLKDVIALLRG